MLPTWDKADCDQQQQFLSVETLFATGPHMTSGFCDLPFQRLKKLPFSSPKAAICLCIDA